MRKPSRERRKPNTLRASVSFPLHTYEELDRLAHAKRVSIAWVVRDAVEDYLSARTPLLPRPDDGSLTGRKVRLGRAADTEGQSG